MPATSMRFRRPTSIVLSPNNSAVLPPTAATVCEFLCVSAPITIIRRGPLLLLIGETGSIPCKPASLVRICFVSEGGRPGLVIRLPQRKPFVATSSPRRPADPFALPDLPQSESVVTP